MENSDGERGSGDGQESVHEQAQLLAAIALNSAEASKKKKDEMNPNQASSTNCLNSWVQNWKPNPNSMDQLMEMGFSMILAHKALYYTQYSNNIEEAINWIMESDPNTSEIPLGNDIYPESFSQQFTNVATLDEILKGEDFKMSFVVNSSLQMGVGKVAAQVAHAALCLHRKMLKQPTRYQPALTKWNQMGETKIVLRGESVEQLQSVQEKAIKLGLPTALIQDAGKTQIPSGSITVVAVFGNREDLHKITGHLKLL